MEPKPFAQHCIFIHIPVHVLVLGAFTNQLQIYNVTKQTLMYYMHCTDQSEPQCNRKLQSHLTQIEL